MLRVEQICSASSDNYSENYRFLISYNLCFNSSDEAIDNITHLLDMFVGLGDCIIKLALSIPIQLCSIIARGILCLLPTTSVTESKNTEITNNMINPKKIS